MMPDFTTNILHLVQNVSCKVYVVYIHCSKYNYIYSTVASYVSISVELLERMYYPKDKATVEQYTQFDINLHTNAFTTWSIIIKEESRHSMAQDSLVVYVISTALAQPFNP